MARDLAPLGYDVHLYDEQAKALNSMPKLPELARDVEWPVIPVLARMEHAGIQLNTDYLHQMGGEIDQMIAAIEKRIYEHAGGEFTIGSGGPEGAFTEELLVREARLGDSILPIPEGIPYEVAAMCEPQTRTAVSSITFGFVPPVTTVHGPISMSASRRASSLGPADARALQHEWHLVDRIHRLQRDNRVLRDVTRDGDLLAQLARLGHRLAIERPEDQA